MNATAIFVSAILGVSVGAVGGFLAGVTRRDKQETQRQKNEPTEKPEALTITEYASNFWVNRDVLRNRVNRAKIAPVEVVRTSNGSYARAFAVSELHKIAETMGKIQQAQATETPTVVESDMPVSPLPSHDEVQQQIQEAQKHSLDLADYSHCPHTRCKDREICKSCLRNPLNFPSHPLLTLWNVPVRIEEDRCSHYQGYTARMKEPHTLYKPVEAGEDGYIGPDNELAEAGVPSKE